MTSRTPIDRPSLDGMPPVMATNWMASVGEKLVDCGYSIIPIWPGAKCPGRYQSSRGWTGYQDWQRHGLRPTTALELTIWKNWPGCGVGIACGQVGALDIDILDADLAAEVEAMARAELGDTPTFRVGLAPKRLLPYRMATPFPKMPRHPLEFLGLGSQFVAYGIHPDTQQPYRWPAEDLHEIFASRLPTVNHEQVVRFLDRAVRIVPPEMRASRLGPDRSAEFYFAAGGDLRGTLEATRDAVAHIPNDDLPYDDWIAVGMAIKGSLGEDGWPIFADWSARSSKNVVKATEKAWKGLKPHSKGFGSLYYYASQNGWSPDHSVTFNAAKAEATQVVDISGLISGSVDSRAFQQKVPHDPETGEVAEHTGNGAAISAVLPEKPAVPPRLSEGLTQSAGIHPGGLIGKLVEWMLETSEQQHPMLAVQAATALVGLLAAHKYRLRRGAHDTRTNVLMVGIAESSAGKDHARKCVKEILARLGMLDFYGEGVASGQAIESAFVPRFAKLYVIDEFGLLVEAALAKNGNINLKKIVETITRLSTSAAGAFKPADRAEGRDPSRDAPLTWDPCLVLLATTVEEPLWRGLSSGNVSDGSLARFLIARTDPFPDIRFKPTHFEDRVEEMAAAVLQVLVGPNVEPTEVSVNLAMGRILAPYREVNGQQVRADPVKPNVFNVPISPDADQRLDELALETLALQRKHHAQRTHGLVGRLKEHVTRLALIAAISANPKHPRVEIEHIRWAEGFVRQSIDLMLEAAAQHVADSEVQRARNSLLAEIGRLSGPKKTWVRHRDLTRSPAGRVLDSDTRNKLLKDLVEMGLIEVGTQKVGNQNVIFYKIEG